jgi:hypothetical protein
LSAPLPRRKVPAIVVVGIELSVGPWASATLTRPSAARVVLRPPAQVYRKVGCSFAAGAVGLAVFGTAAASVELRAHVIPILGDRLPTALLVVLAVLCLFWLLLWNWVLLFGGRRVSFDTHTRQMTYSPLWSRHSRPLSHIVAVQLLSEILTVNLQIPTRSAGPVETKQVRRFPMNLVLDDPNTPRINVADSEDEDWTRRAGKELADFLGIPLIDQIAATT